ncbi:hypothetical protein SELMODRAFT_38785, partial [Selaginella moellendorffii]
PSHQHFCCMIELLGRSGRLREAEEFAASMPAVEMAMSRSLVGACNLNGESDRGERIARRALECDPENAAPYVMLTSVYS